MSDKPTNARAAIEAVERALAALDSAQRMHGPGNWAVPFEPDDVRALLALAKLAIEARDVLHEGHYAETDHRYSECDLLARLDALLGDGS